MVAVLDAADVDAWLVAVQTPFDVPTQTPNQRALRGALKGASVRSS